MSPIECCYHVWTNSTTTLSYTCYNYWMGIMRLYLVYDPIRWHHNSTPSGITAPSLNDWNFKTYIKLAKYAVLRGTFFEGKFHVKLPKGKNYTKMGNSLKMMTRTRGLKLSLRDSIWYPKGVGDIDSKLRSM